MVHLCNMDIPGEDDKMDLFGPGQKQMPFSFPSPSCLLRHVVVGCRERQPLILGGGAWQADPGILTAVQPVGLARSHTPGGVLKEHEVSF